MVLLAFLIRLPISIAIYKNLYFTFKIFYSKAKQKVDEMMIFKGIFCPALLT